MRPTRKAYQDHLESHLDSFVDAFHEPGADLRRAVAPLLPVACDAGLLVDSDDALYWMAHGRAIPSDPTHAHKLLWDQIQSASTSQLEHYDDWAEAYETRE